jgi:flavin-dependent dehydrogenase
VLIADGRGAWLRPRPAPSTELGLKAHFQNVGANPDAITLYGGIGCYGGVAPIEADAWNAAFSIPRSMAADAKGDLNAIWEMIVRRSPVIASHFHSAMRVSDWLASPLPRHRVVREWHSRVIPIGAAACAIEPVGGEGMGTALRSAELAANALLAGTLDQLQAAYQKLWNRRSLFCQIGGRALADEGWSDSVGLASHTVLARVAMKLVGK